MENLFRIYFTLMGLPEIAVINISVKKPWKTIVEFSSKFKAHNLNITYDEIHLGIFQKTSRN